MKNRLVKDIVTALGISLTALAGIGTLAGTASAQTAGEPSATGTQWFKVCSKQADNDICNTQFTLIADTRQLITAINLIDVKGKVNQRVLQAVVPTGRVIPAGVQLQIDQGSAQSMNYSVCFPDRCIAEAALTDAVVASLKKGNGLTVTSVNFQRQPNPVKITLSGFSKAYDGPPVAQPELAQRQQELNDALQKKNDARRKALEDAQTKAKASGAAPAQ